MTMLKKIKFRIYRAKTFFTAFKKLYFMPQDKVDAFMNSFDAFDYDWQEEDKLSEELGQEFYSKIQAKVVDYYYVTNLFCALGPVEKMYVPPNMDKKLGVIKNQELFENSVIEKLGIDSTSNVLDVGCGKGRAAHYVAKTTGAKVTGLNIDASQIQQAKEYAKAEGLDGRMEFFVRDMNDQPFPFENESFDGIYNLGAFTYCRNYETMFKEIHRLLKPGARFSFFDFVKLKNYDSNNKEHVLKVNQIKPLLGAISVPEIETIENALKDAGFTIVFSGIPGEDGLQGDMITATDKKFEFLRKTTTLLTKIKLLPKHLKTIQDKFDIHVKTYVEVDKLKLASAVYHIIAEKSESTTCEKEV